MLVNILYANRAVKVAHVCLIIFLLQMYKYVQSLANSEKKNLSLTNLYRVIIECKRLTSVQI